MNEKKKNITPEELADIIQNHKEAYAPPDVRYAQRLARRIVNKINAGKFTVLHNCIVVSVFEFRLSTPWEEVQQALESYGLHLDIYTSEVGLFTKFYIQPIIKEKLK